MACLPSFVEITAIIASLVPWECKQAVISSQEGKQAIKTKAGAIKCCKEKNTPPPNEWVNIPIHSLLNKINVFCFLLKVLPLSRSSINYE